MLKTLPLGQYAHAVIDIFGANVPFGHGWHAPVPVPNVPAWHGSPFGRGSGGGEEVGGEIHATKGRIKLERKPKTTTHMSSRRQLPFPGRMSVRSAKPEQPSQPW